MAKILVIEESVNQNLLVNSFYTAGIEVVDLGNHSVEIIKNLLNNIGNINNSELMMNESIFPAIPKLE